MPLRAEGIGLRAGGNPLLYHFAMKVSYYGKAKVLKKLYFPEP